MTLITIRNHLEKQVDKNQLMNRIRQMDGHLLKNDEMRI